MAEQMGKHDFKIGDRVRTPDSAPTNANLRGKEGVVTRVGMRDSGFRVSVLVDDAPKSSGADGSWYFKPERLTLVETMPTEEEIERLFGIKKEEELKAEAQQLIGMANATVVRLEARELRIEVEADNPNNDRWKEVVEAKNEVKLARAAALELEADYIEKYGLQTFRKDFF